MRKYFEKQPPYWQKTQNWVFITLASKPETLFMHEKWFWKPSSIMAEPRFNFLQINVNLTFPMLYKVIQKYGQPTFGLPFICLLPSLLQYYGSYYTLYFYLNILI